jgi:hypothetical protein
LEKQWRAADLQYAETSGSHYLTEPRGGLYLLSRELFDQYAPLVQ